MIDRMIVHFVLMCRYLLRMVSSIKRHNCVVGERRSPVEKLVTVGQGSYSTPWQDHINFVDFTIIKTKQVLPLRVSDEQYEFLTRRKKVVVKTTTWYLPFWKLEHNEILTRSKTTAH